MAKHHFYLKANWPGNRNDVGDIKSGRLETAVSIPKEMDGPGEGTNPDEMSWSGRDLLYYNACGDDGKKRPG